MLSFYTEPAFFVLVAIAFVPALVLGVKEKSLKGYGTALSVVFVTLLLCSSLQESVSFIIFLAVSFTVTFVTQRLFAQEHTHAVALYRVALVVALMPLVIAKLAALFDQNILGFIGLSYLTFRSVQVLIEIRDGLIQNLHPYDYVYFLIFFPIFTSGPITRSRDFIAQINSVLPKKEYLDLVAQGCLWLLKGAMYTFVLAAFFQWLMWFAPSACGNDTTLQIAASELSYALSYGLYLFFDFAGYTSMAMGVGAFLGVQVPPNFNAPFLSVDIKDFWNRWHMSLSFWLRDYVFMRLSKALIRHKVCKSRVVTACCGFMANMTIMGVWHGLTFDCIVYGIYHGILLCACEVFQKKSNFYKKNKKKQWFRVLSWALTMIAVFFGFAIFSGQFARLLFGA